MGGATEANAEGPVGAGSLEGLRRGRAELEAGVEPAWPPSKGEMARRVRQHDWAATPLGPISEWPDRLRGVVELVLDSPVVATVALLEERLLIYNDAAARLYGDRHPAALGRPLGETFPDSYPSVAPFYDRVFAGEAVTVRAQPLAVGTGDGGEVFDAYLTPVRGIDGAVVAAHMVGLEIGGRLRAEAALRESEAQSRILFDSIDEGFCTIEVLFDGPAGAGGKACDYRFLRANPAFVRQTGLHDAIGRTVREMVPGHEEHWYETYGRIALTGEPARFELRAEALGRWYDVYAFRIGRPEERQVAVLFRDVLERKHTEAALRESEARQAFLLGLTDALRPLADARAMAAEASRLLGEHLCADRTFLTEVEADGMTLLVRDEHLRSGASSVLGRYRFDQFGAFVGRALHQGRTLAVEDVSARTDLDAAERANYAAVGIAAYLLVPLVRGGRLAAFLTVNHRTPRAWTEADRAVARQTADRAWADVERARAEAALRESEARLAAVFEVLPVGVGVFDAHGALLLSNQEIRRFMPTGIMPSQDEAQRSRWRARHPDGRPVEPQDFPGARALRSGCAVQGIEMLHTHDDGREEWTSVSAVPLRDHDGRVAGAAVVVAGIDALKRLQGQQEVLIAELQHRTRNLLGVVRSLARSSLHPSPGLDEYDARLAALGRVQGFLSRSPAYSVPLAELVGAELAAVGEGASGRVTVEGPAVELPGGGVQAVALALHELATNAVKHGAIAQASGRLSVAWRVQVADGAGQRLVIHWQESGVPMHGALPSHRGYGSELITEALPYQLGAETELEFAPDGVRCRITLPTGAFSSSEEAQA